MSKDMGKEGKQQSILVDLYNLKLTGNPKTDEPQILQFFEKDVPEVVRYKTAKEARRPDQLRTVPPKPAWSINQDAIGTLGAFEFLTGKSWFDSNETANFYGLYRLAHEVVDNYLEAKEIPRDFLAWVASLTSNIRINLTIEHTSGKRFGFSNAPKSVNPNEYSFGEIIVQHHSVTVGPSQEVKAQLNLGGMKFRLFREILSLWNREIRIRKCTFEGGERNPPCNNVFITSRGQRYCSKKCYDKARRLRRYQATGR